MRFGLFSMIVSCALLFTSCRGIPLGLLKTVDFEMDEESLAALNDYYGKLDIQCYGMRRAELEDGLNDITLYVDKNTSMWCENRDGISVVYKDGVMYSRDAETDEPIQENTTFDIEQYKSEVKFARMLLEAVLNGKASDFEVETAEITVVEKNLVCASMNYTGDLTQNKELAEAFLDFKVNYVSLVTNHLKDTGEFVLLHFMFGTDQYNYSIMFGANNSYSEDIQNEIDYLMYPKDK